MRDVKTRSGTRREAAAATRQRILGAASELFLANGYASTTIKQVADRAAVAVQTVYWTFGTKTALVTGIRDAWLREARTSERLADVLAIADHGDRLAAAAAFMRRQWETGASAVAIQQDAARSDPRVRAEIESVLADRSRQLARIVQPIRPDLRHEVRPDEAVDVFLALTSFETYRELRARRWSNDRYERWLARTLRESLLGS